MGRQMPIECEHGVIVDGGDFAKAEICRECEDIIQDTVNRLYKSEGMHTIKDLPEIIALHKRLEFLEEMAHDKGEIRIKYDLEPGCICFACRSYQVTDTEGNLLLNVGSLSDIEQVATNKRNEQI